MTQEEEKQTSAEVEAAPDVPSDQAKKAEEAPKASTTVPFINKVKVFGFDASTGAISSEEVLATDSGSSGGEMNVASDYSRFPGSGSKLESGPNLAQRDIGKLNSGFDANQVQPTTVVLEGAGEYKENGDGLFEPAFHTNDMYQQKGVSSGSSNQFGEVYRRTPLAVGVQKIVYARGQVDDASLDKLYPNASLDAQGQPTEKLTVDHGNYLLKQMKFTVTNGELSGVTFVTKELPCGSSVGALRMLTDHTKTHMMIAQNKISDWSKQVAEGGRDYYPPIVNGTVQPARHLALAEDIVACDGAIAYAAAKSICEAYAYGMFMRTKLGGRKGSITLGAMMAQPVTPFADSDHYGTASKLGKWTDLATHTPTAPVLAQENIAALLALDRKSGWNAYFGSLINQPMFKSAYEHMLAAFDGLDYKIDKDAYSLMNKTFGWFKDSEADMICGVDRYGIVLPYNPGTYFNYVDVLRSGEKELDGACHIINSYNSKSQVLASIGSPLFKGMTDFFRDTILPMLNLRCNRFTGDYIVDFDFPTNRFSAGAFFIALAMPQIVAQLGIDYVNGYYTEFQKKWGLDPFSDDTTVSVTTADVLNTAAFRGLGVAPVFQEAHDALKLVLSDPEYIIAEGGMFSRVAGVGACVTGMLNVHPGITNIINDDDDSVYNYGRPVVEVMTQVPLGLKRILDTSRAGYFKTRDLPIRPYKVTVTGEGSKVLGLNESVEYKIKDGASGLYDAGNFVPFYSADGTHSTFIITPEDIMSVRRVNGRFAPAPGGYLDGDTVTNKAAAIVSIDFKDETAGGNCAITVLPTETYDFIYLQDEKSYEPQQMGSATYLDAFIMSTGGITADQLKEVVLLGYYVDTPIGVTVKDNELASFANPNHSSDVVFVSKYKPEAAYKLWPTAFGYPFAELPTTGVSNFSLAATGASALDDRSQLQLNEAFGLKYIGRIDYSRYTEAVRKQRAAPDAYLTNDLERQDNYFA